MTHATDFFEAEPDFSDVSAETLALQRPSSSSDEPLVSSICQSTTFVQREVGGQVKNTYSRAGNPTVDALEAILGRLENAPPSVCFSTGLAAETALFFALLKTGDHLVLSQAIYGGTVPIVPRLAKWARNRIDFCRCHAARKHFGRDYRTHQVDLCGNALKPNASAE